MSQPMNEPEPPTGRDRLWPFGIRVALLATSSLLVVLIVVVAVSEHLSGWPPGQAGGAVFGGVLLLSLLPIGLLVIDVVAARGGSLGYGPLKIEFAQVLLPPSIGISLPSNIALAGAPVYDSSSGEISRVLADATKNEIAIVDLEDGNAWWPTRLLVLCAGAKRIGQPTAVVFLATEGLVPGLFQGWARPADLADALLHWKPEFREPYFTSQIVANQLRLIRPPHVIGAVPNVPAGFDLAQQYVGIVFQPGVTEPSPVMEEQVLAVELGKLEAAQPPAGITIVKLKEVFASVLFTGAIDREAAAEQQLDIFLQQNVPYTAMTCGRRYEGLLPITAGHRAILQQLLKQRSARQ